MMPKQKSLGNFFFALMTEWREKQNGYGYIDSIDWPPRLRITIMRGRR